MLEYAQYVAGPFAGMLLADLGADVVKVEAPAGDAWRRYQPFATGESRYFYALNRNKRSVVLDLKTDGGTAREPRAARRAPTRCCTTSRPSARARYGLDRESVRAANPRAAWCMVSALGTDGPEAELTAFDLVAQALLGAAARRRAAGRRDPAPRGRHRDGRLHRRAAGRDLAARRARRARREAGARRRGVAARRGARGAGAAVRVGRAATGARATREPATPDDLADHGARVRASEELEPYYRAYRAADGFFVLTCLNEAQRRTTLRLLGLEDPFVADPQAAPACEAERAARVQLVRRFEAILAREPAAHWIRRLRAAGVPAAQVRTLDQLYDDPQAHANGLVQDVAAPAGRRRPAARRRLQGRGRADRGAARRPRARRAHRRGARRAGREPRT